MTIEFQREKVMMALRRMMNILPNLVFVRSLPLSLSITFCGKRKGMALKSAIFRVACCRLKNYLNDCFH